MHVPSKNVVSAREFLGGREFPAADVDKLWRALKQEDFEFGYARRVLERLRVRAGIRGEPPSSPTKLCQQHALCTSKDADLSAASRHDMAIKILQEILSAARRGDGEVTERQETLGIAGGIYKRRWQALGDVDDLEHSLRYYELGSSLGLANDLGYNTINAAFMHDLLADAGRQPESHLQSAELARRQLVTELPGMIDQSSPAPLDKNWWFLVTLAEACFGLGRVDGRYYEQSEQWLAQACALPDVPYWEYQSFALQLDALLALKSTLDADLPRRLVKQLIDNVSDAPVVVSKIGLALSGGGFRASFFHLGFLARLAEADVLRHVDSLSCVSGGSIVGAQYFLAVRNMLSEQPSGSTPPDYVALVNDLIERFVRGVTSDIRQQVQGKRFKRTRASLRLWRQQGALSGASAADCLEKQFYQPMLGGNRQVYMHDLGFTPSDHDPAWRRQGEFNPIRHNWRRAHKVPALVINATTVNTGHNWQFTTSSMGEAPYTLREEADSVPRLRRSWYQREGKTSRRVTLGQAVAASAAVPGIFTPLKIAGLYPDNGEPFEVSLVDGGVCDNQGASSLLARDCNVILVSDAAGQLLANHGTPSGLRGLTTFASRLMDVLMERVRQVTYDGLETRRQARRLRGLMFVHMKMGLRADPVDWHGCEDPGATLPSDPLSPCGIRRDVQQAVAELRTDLNAFLPEEYLALMACGYQMAAHSLHEIAHVPGLVNESAPANWPFSETLQTIVGASGTEAHRETLLATLRAGSKVSL